MGDKEIIEIENTFYDLLVYYDQFFGLKPIKIIEENNNKDIFTGRTMAEKIRKLELPVGANYLIVEKKNRDTGCEYVFKVFKVHGNTRNNIYGKYKVVQRFAYKEVPEVNECFMKVNLYYQDKWLRRTKDSFETIKDEQVLCKLPTLNELKKLVYVLQ